MSTRRRRVDHEAAWRERIINVEPRAQSNQPYEEIMAEYVIPARFWEDHVGRTGVEESGKVIKTTAKSVTVALDPAQLADLKSDAQHYAEGTKDYWEEYPGLVLSARATLNALRMQGA